MSVYPDIEMIKLGWSCKCPKCRKGSLYKPGFTLDLRNNCSECGLDFTKNDSADGPAMFLIFILGFSLVPIALIVDAAYGWPLWFHGLVWGALALLLTVGSLRPLKAYVIALQFKHRPKDWE
ncbi:MAG: DUF983 domain-containing protein [Pseudomonadota bacterium]